MTTQTTELYVLSKDDVEIMRGADDACRDYLARHASGTLEHQFQSAGYSLETAPAAAARKVRHYQRHTTGSQHQYRHPFGLLYTEGMRYLADTCAAHWLLDLVASHQPEIHPEWASFQVWRLRVLTRDEAGEPETWEASAWSDTPETSTRLVRQVIQYSDFPEALCLPDSEGFQWWVEHGCAMLKEER